MEVRVRNTGSRIGREVVQVYVSGEEAGDGKDAPPRLVGFDTVVAAPDEIVTALIRIDRRTLARWDEKAARWLVAGGPRTLTAAHSVADARLTTQVELKDREA
jgi:beta-glucosidase